MQNSKLLHHFGLKTPVKRLFIEKQAHSYLFYEAKETGREKWAEKRHFATFLNG